MKRIANQLAVALRDAQTLVQDIANNWPVRELHKHPDVFRSEAAAALAAFDAVQQDTAPKPQFILIKGNPGDGFTYVGPFASSEAAVAAGDTVDNEWWVAELERPDDE